MNNLHVFTGSETAIAPVLAEAIWNEHDEIESWEFIRGRITKLSIVYKEAA